MGRLGVILEKTGADMLPSQIERFVQTDPEKGLTDEDFRKAAHRQKSVSEAEGLRLESGFREQKRLVLFPDCRPGHADTSKSETRSANVPCLATRVSGHETHFRGKFCLSRQA